MRSMDRYIEELIDEGKEEAAHSVMRMEDTLRTIQASMRELQQVLKLDRRYPGKIDPSIYTDITKDCEATVGIARSRY